MRSLADRIAALSIEKRSLVEQHLRQKKSQVAPEGIRRRERPDAPVPLSFAQERLWFLSQLEPGHSFYNLPFALRLSARLDAGKLEESLNEIVRRHEALRTRFIVVNDRPMQVVLPRVHVGLVIINLEDVAQAEREAESQRLAIKEAQKPFNLEQDILIRASLLRLSDVDHVLLLTMHHIVSDGWSFGILHRELSHLYVALQTGNPSPLPELPIQYADYAVWQRNLLQGETLDRLLSYWTKKLAGIPPLLELYTDRQRPAVQAFQGASYSFPIPQSMLEELKGIGRQTQGTLFMVLLAAFQVLLFRYSGQSDLVVGTPIANRTQRELEGLIGFFVNTLVLRTDLGDDPTFLQLVDRVREVTLEAFDHQSLPFEKLVEELHPKRNLSHNPIFQVMFALQNTEAGQQVGPQSSAPQRLAGTSKFDLTLAAMEMSDGLTLTIEYNTMLFDDSTIVSMAENFRALLKNAIANPKCHASKLLFLAADERMQVIGESSGPSDTRSLAVQIHELCEMQARLRPQETAIVFGGQQLTYQELNARANQVAHALRQHRAGPEVLVAIYMDRSAEMIVAVLATLKAGSAFLPLDPAYPKERIRYMLDDSGAALLLTQEHLVPSLPPFAGKLLRLDADWPLLAQCSEADPVPLSTPDNLAYVIYTSGSTGRPKGVAVQHRGVCNLIEAQFDAFSLPPQSRILLFASLSFDASIFEILMSLGAGGILYMSTREAILPGAPLIKILRDEKINVLSISPSALAVLPRVALPDLHTLISVGESCPMEMVSRWCHERRFFNAYGPTEVSIWSTLAQCGENSAIPPIGRPLRNIRAYILDEHLEPVPSGLPGELYLGGVGVARGYHRRPDLTAERYLPDPFSGQPGTRMYKTGDRVRRVAGGDIQFLGRIDQQVKLRGYRIELGEIEASLLRHPEIQEAAVALRSTRSGDDRVVAYCVAASEQLPGATELREFLRQSLPDFMVPSAFVQLDSLPLNTSGKLDRRALPSVSDELAEPGGELWSAPQSEIEKRLTEIWCEILALPRVGIHDNFFDLGGHSLLATRVMSRMNEAFQTDLRLRQIFELPTIAMLSEVVEEERVKGSKRREPAIRPVAREVVVLPKVAALPE